MSRGKETGIFVGLALAFAVLIFAALLLLGSVDEQRKAVAWVSETRDVLAKINEVVTSLSDAENGRRGYAITGSDRYLVHHTNAVVRVQKALTELRGQVNGNPTQSNACDQLEELIQKRLAISTSSIQERRANALDVARQTTFMEEGQKAMEPIRALAEQMISVEKNRLIERQVTQEKNIEGTKGFAVLVSLCGLALFTVLLVLFSLANRRRHAAEEALQRSNQELEQRVLDRTAQLQKANERADQLNLELEERVRERTAQLEGANRELEAFSYSVSHDLRAPLRHIHGYVEMLKSDMEGQLGEKPLRYFKTIIAAAVAMGQLIDGLIAFSRMGRIELREMPVRLKELVDETIGGLELSAQGRNIVWKIEALPVVLGDPATLKQVFANLIGNAIKYTQHRDPAEIEIGKAGEKNGRVIFFVRDNGAGFDMQYAHKLFGVFHRLHRQDEFEGTGIGLATVRRIVERHGGETWAEGALEKGATVYFTLKPAALLDQN